MHFKKKTFKKISALKQNVFNKNIHFLHANNAEITVYIVSLI